MRIELNDISFSYGRARRRKPAAPPFVLSDIGVTIPTGQMLALAGRSGSGKSTFLQLMKGFIAPSLGSVELNGTDPHLARRAELFDKVGFIFQYPEHQLFANTVFDDIAFGLRAAKLAPDIVETKVRLAMEAVRLDYDEFKDRSPFELSGGEKRRVAIAGVVVLEPGMLILDEPTAGLDLQSRRSLFELLHRMNQEQGITVLWVSHQLDEILEHAARLIVIHNGRLAADGNPSELLSDSALLDALGWEEPPALAVYRLLRELGLWDDLRLPTASEAAAIIARHAHPSDKILVTTKSELK
ncbi:ATP-binding cassette domain-containing protein [Paenibacillus sp. HN-1]|uniref:ATP-binding cassette domain-containing protein n=1 Tax=Paenibacillus TaxID=44249 RepID=UPI001CA9F05A|nr:MULTISPECIES: ATP-binding cassette domain-containing protein [Paenibacillus]MBY9078101.1 ATP-binding cassette domain-containing protein [Paenibacillus sp. CGMCC 1.18879]MBY9083842.1 ATP-binding cassette domain-containing protein [Paenibacillus sinensis]